MPESQPLIEWIAKFKARYDLDFPLGADPSVVEERAAQAAAYAAEHTPIRYATALPTLPAIHEWVAAVVQAAVAQSQEAGRTVASIQTGPSRLLLGRTGVGKTYEAYGALRLISLLGIYAKWQLVPAADLYARLRPRAGVDSETEFRAVADAPVLAVDDLGASKGSAWVEEVNYRLVNHRYERCLPTLFTSNLPPKDIPARPEGPNGEPPTPPHPGLATVLGDRVASRLREMAPDVPMKGTDRRQK